MKNKLLALAAAAIFLTSCGTQKSATETSFPPGGGDPSAVFVEKIIGGAMTEANVTGSATVKLRMGGETMKLSGALRMRRDEVIRLQLMLPVIGTEAARIEFTPDSVLILDRINRQYVKIGYDRVDFLESNNISFYSLQSLFWNELVSPEGRRALAGDAGKYEADLDGAAAYVPVTMTAGGNTYRWQASAEGKISSLVVTRQDSVTPSTFTWLYDGFVQAGGKKFPRTQEMSYSAMADDGPVNMSVTIEMNEVKTSGDWDAVTAVSPKYKRADYRSVARLLGNL